MREKKFSEEPSFRGTVEGALRSARAVGLLDNNNMQDI